jgi:hypothetical protein
VSTPARGEPAAEPEHSPEPDSEPAPSLRPASGAVPPEQSREDTDAGWGEYPVTEDERLYQDRPPHWDDF